MLTMVLLALLLDTWPDVITVAQTGLIYPVAWLPVDFIWDPLFSAVQAETHWEFIVMLIQVSYFFLHTQAI